MAGVVAACAAYATPITTARKSSTSRRAADNDDDDDDDDGAEDEGDEEEETVQTKRRESRLGALKRKGSTASTVPYMQRKKRQGLEKIDREIKELEKEIKKDGN